MKMKTIPEILALRPRTEKIKRKERKTEEVDIAFFKDCATAYGKYEMEVFRYLYDNRKSLEIETVYAFRNQMVDGELLLQDGTLVPIEIKFRLSWDLACRANTQFSNFFGRIEDRICKNGIVFFEQFSKGWDKTAKSRSVQNGWLYWYENHFLINGIKFQIIRLFNGKAEGYGDIVG